MISFNAKLAEVVARDPRFAYEAYEFIYQALDHTLKMLGREKIARDNIGHDNVARERAAGDAEGGEAGHVAGRELLDGIRSLALKEFGLMAATVFRQWGLRGTGDFGTIIFNLIGAGLLSKTDEDNLEDFRDGFDFDLDLTEGYEITLDEAR
ncbi:MAG: hypothetical protein HY040_18765 [Planctomycetes bacterium]|nr:hypothetical protein [Planctomycetota bacterium]